LSSCVLRLSKAALPATGRGADSRKRSAATEALGTLSSAQQEARQKAARAVRSSRSAQRAPAYSACAADLTAPSL